MKKIGIFYESKEGQTKKVVDFLTKKLQEADCQVHINRCRDAKPGELEDLDLVVIGNSIHMGKHNKKAIEFAKSNLEKLKAKPSAFFFLCLTARSDGLAEQQEVESYAFQFKEASGWIPGLVKSFAGALLYTQYGFLIRSIMKKIQKKQNGETDTSKDHDYTNWEEVSKFAEELLLLS